MGILNPSPTQLRIGNRQDAWEQAAQELEALVIKQLIQSSGAFRGGSTPGASLYGDIFAETLAEAVAHSQEMGLASCLNAVMPGKAAPVTPSPALPFPVPHSGKDSENCVLSQIVPGGRISSSFGMRSDPFTGTATMHSGVDIAAPEGTLIYAPADGVVFRAGERGNYGLALELNHRSFSTVYGHATELLVQSGEHVRKGQPIARVGKTGRATGPHLHLEVRVDNRPVEPQRMLNEMFGHADN